MYHLCPKICERFRHSRRCYQAMGWRRRGGFSCQWLFTSSKLTIFVLTYLPFQCADIDNVLVTLLTHEPSVIKPAPLFNKQIQDITHAAMSLSNHATNAINIFADHCLSIRSQLKDVRTKEEQLDELRRRRKAVGSKLEAQERRLSKMSSEVCKHVNSPLRLGLRLTVISISLPPDSTSLYR